MWRPVIARLWAAAPALRARTGIAAPDRVVAGYPGTCAVFIIDERAVIKFFPPMVAGDGAREAAVYRLLDGRVPGASLLAAGVFPDRIDWPYLVVSHVSGAAWREIGATIAPMQQEVILQTMGRAVRRVHETPLGNEGWTSSARWGEFISHSLSEIDLRLQRDTSFSPALIDDLISLLSTIDLVRQPATPPPRRPDRQSPAAGRASRSWAMTGLIDWADAMVGDPYYSGWPFRSTCAAARRASSVRSGTAMTPMASCNPCPLAACWP